MCDQLTRIRVEFESKLYHARCAAEKCADESARLESEKIKIITELKEKEAAQKRAEQDAEKLRLTLRFERDLHRQELKEICKQSKMNNQRCRIKISEKFKAQMNESLNGLRVQLEDQLRMNRINFDNQMKILQGPGMLADAGGSAINSIGGVQGALISAQSQLAALQAQLLECQSIVASLELQIKYWLKVLEDDEKQIDNLTKIIQELCKKYQKLLDDKIKIQSELDAYNSLLQSEESRLQLTDMCDSLPKKEGEKGSTSKKKYEFEMDYYPSHE